jgi:hypothetical protein
LIGTVEARPALQSPWMHGVGQRPEPLEVRWRNIRIRQF